MRGRVLEDGANARGRDTGHRASSGSGLRNHSDFIWSVADLLRGDYKQSGYGKVMFARTEKVLFEGPVYGNAIYILGPDWRRLSRMSKQELLSGRARGINKIVHKGNWFGGQNGR